MDNSYGYFFEIFLNEISIYGVKDRQEFYDYLKSLFFNYSTCKWSILKYQKFVKTNNLNYRTCHQVMNDFRHSYLVNRPKTIGFTKFLNKIERFNDLEDSKKLILKIKKQRVKAFTYSLYF